MTRAASSQKKYKIRHAPWFAQGSRGLRLAPAQAHIIVCRRLSLKESLKELTTHDR